ncbi:MAG: hypothetical protein DRH93_16170, partial [Deltaproteobacteria bacterium]
GKLFQFFYRKATSYKEKYYSSNICSIKKLTIQIHFSNIISFNLGMQKSEGLGNKSNPYRRD